MVPRMLSFVYMPLEPKKQDTSQVVAIDDAVVKRTYVVSCIQILHKTIYLGTS